MKPGDRVTITTPDNPLAHGRVAAVKAVYLEWLLLATDFGSGEFRALPEEVSPLEKSNGQAKKSLGYTGDLCDTCGGCRMRRNGACLLCDDCGATSGCS